MIGDRPAEPAELGCADRVCRRLLVVGDTEPPRAWQGQVERLPSAPDALRRVMIWGQEERDAAKAAQPLAAHALHVAVPSCPVEEARDFLRFLLKAELALVGRVWPVLPAFALSKAVRVPEASCPAGLEEFRGRVGRIAATGAPPRWAVAFASGTADFLEAELQLHGRDLQDHEALRADWQGVLRTFDLDAARVFAGTLRFAEAHLTLPFEVRVEGSDAGWSETLSRLDFPSAELTAFQVLDLEASDLAKLRPGGLPHAVFLDKKPGAILSPGKALPLSFAQHRAWPQVLALLRRGVLVRACEAGLGRRRAYLVYEHAGRAWLRACCSGQDQRALLAELALGRQASGRKALAGRELELEKQRLVVRGEAGSYHGPGTPYKRRLVEATHCQRPSIGLHADQEPEETPCFAWCQPPFRQAWDAADLARVAELRSLGLEASPSWGCVHALSTPPLAS